MSEQGYARGEHPESLANLDPQNRASSGAWSVLRGRTPAPWLPWAADVDALVASYLEALAVELEPECHLCAALAQSAARARGAMACLEAAGRDQAIPFASKGGMRRLWLNVFSMEDRWLSRLKELADHKRMHTRNGGAGALEGYLAQKTGGAAS